MFQARQQRRELFAYCIFNIGSFAVAYIFIFRIYLTRQGPSDMNIEIGQALLQGFIPFGRTCQSEATLRPIEIQYVAFDIFIPAA